MAKRNPKGQRTPPPSGNLPKHGKEMLAAVYESAADRLESEGIPAAEAKERASRQAWCAVKRHYYKRGTKWHRRQRPMGPDQSPPGCEPYRENNPAKFAEGDVVRYTAKFLKSIGSYTGNPINGKIVGFTKMGAGKEFPLVHWSDADEAVAVHPGNIELDPRSKRQRNRGVPPEEKERRRRRSTSGKKAYARKRRSGRKRFPNEAVVPGDKVKVTKKHARVHQHQTGVVEDLSAGTVWVRLDHSGNLLGVGIDDVELVEKSPLRNAVQQLMENPAEEIAAAAYAYTAALDEQVRAIRTGQVKLAAQAKKEASSALRQLELLAARGSSVPAAIGAAIGAALGSLAGAPGAAVGGVLGSLTGSWLSRPFTAAEAEKAAGAQPKAITDGRYAPPTRTAGPIQMPPSRTYREPPRREHVTPTVEPVSQDGDAGLEGFEEFFEEPAMAANPTKKMKRRLLR